MFDSLLKIFGDDGIHKIASLVAISSQVIKNFEQEYKDPIAMNTAIDVLVEILKKHKKD